MKIALGQTNPLVGDIVGNVAAARKCIGRAREAGCDVVVFPELSLLGYPPRDLLRKEQFVADSEAAVGELAADCTGISALVGFVKKVPGSSGRPLANAAAVLSGGRVSSVHTKTLLPTYDVFDETRYFEPGPPNDAVIDIDGHKVGLTICEDLWDAAALGRKLYADDPVGQLAAANVELVINMAASPFEIGKIQRREDLLARQAKRCGCPIVYVNQVGGNDELVFDGSSCVVDGEGTVIARATSFDEDLLIVDLPGGGRVEPVGEPIERLTEALKLGLRDYVRKCGFSSVVLGLSGGIDSAVVAALAAAVLGPENVVAIAMPSRYSSDHSIADARGLAERMGLQFRMTPIEPMHAAFEQSLNETLGGKAGELAAENIQARIRGNIVMACSNAEGHLALATGNKSELSVGYCTLYGDMCGGLAPIGDLLKTTVYDVGRYLNTRGAGIPENTFTKPPSAELKPGQVDQDKLPPYDDLDAILALYVEQDRPVEEIVAAGHDAGTVARVVAMIDLSEYKRKQAAPALKVTQRAFGVGRRMPIAQGYRP